MKKLILILSALLVLLVCSTGHTFQDKYNNYMDTADDYMSAKNYEKASQNYRKAVNYSIKKYGSTSLQTFTALLGDTASLTALGDYDMAYAASVLAYNIAKKQNIKVLEGSVCCTLGHIQYSRGRIEDSIKYYRKGIAILEFDEHIKTNQDYRSTFIYSLLNLASILEESDDGTPIEIEYLRLKAKRFQEGWNN